MVKIRVRAGLIYVRADVTEIVKQKILHMLDWFLRHGEWRGAYAKEDPWWTPARRAAAGISGVDDGLFAMSVEDYRKRFTRLDCSSSFLPHEISDNSMALQVAGMLTKEKCGGSAQWWKNPRAALTLNGPTNLTITLNQPVTCLGILPPLLLLI